MLRSCVIDFEGSWIDHLPLIEFAYNNSHQRSIGMTYEALYGRKCRTLVCWIELGEDRLVVPDLIRQTEEKVKIIRDILKTASDRQKSYADLKKKDIEYEVGEKVFLKVSAPELEKIHNVFHVSILRRYSADPSHRVSTEIIEIQLDLTYEEESVKILDREIRELRNKRISLVKVLWRNHNAEEAT
ncbi:hypothetical protein ACOSP7_007522 [Xanthoceras sorbifolium]